MSGPRGELAFAQGSCGISALTQPAGCYRFSEGLFALRLNQLSFEKIEGESS